MNYIGIIFYCMLFSFSLGETLLVPENYSRIQRAIDVAVEGDTILVNQGTYCENIILNKSVTLASYAIFENLDNLKEIDKISIEMENGITSMVYLFHPNDANSKLVVYHQGHSNGFIKGKSTINEFLKNGYSVAAFSMPLIEKDHQPIIDIPNIGHIKFQEHKQFSLLETDDFSPLTYFFTPITLTLNYLDKNYEFTDYHMIGISGGGWTTTVYSGIDSRISKSFAISGSLPLPLRYQVQDIGDWEQLHPGIYNIASYLDLYIMSSHGENREFVQIFNKHDPCCFAGTLYELYEDEVRDTTSTIGNGKYSVYLDSSHMEHKISDDVIEFILQTIN